MSVPAPEQDPTPAGTVLAALRAVLGAVTPPVPVHDAHVPTRPHSDQPVDSTYAVLWPSPGQRLRDALADNGSRDRLLRWQVTSVGESRQSAVWVSERCQDALLDNRLEVPGWAPAPVEHLSSSPVRQDDDLPGEPLFVAVDTYEMRITR